MTSSPHILICDDDKTYHLLLQKTLTPYCFFSAYNKKEALSLLQKHPMDLLVLDIRFKGESKGLSYIPQFRKLIPKLPIVISSAHRDFSLLRKALQLGAQDYVLKELGAFELKHVIENILEKETLKKKHAQNIQELKHEAQKHILIGKSPLLAHIRTLIQKYKKSTAPVLILGETGTGKELIARQFRTTLDENLIPFVALDASTIQQSMAESLLFGHKKGSFTGATEDKKGLFEAADGGVFYLDEIGNLSLEVQQKLLRVIQEKEILPVGATHPNPIHVRIISATNKNLETCIQNKTFLPDLYQRICTLPLEIPPLRDRPEDIPILIEHFIQRENTFKPLSFSKDAWKALKTYPWPGNIRELKNLIAYLSVVYEGEMITFSKLPPKFSKKESIYSEQNFYLQIQHFEKALLQKHLSKASNLTQLAAKLGMDRSHLHTKIKKYDLSSFLKKVKNRNSDRHPYAS